MCNVMDGKEASTILKKELKRKYIEMVLLLV